MPAKGNAISSENTVVIARLILTIPALPPTVSQFFQFAIPAEEPSMCGLPIHRFSIGRAIAFLVVASLPFCRTSVADEPIAEPNLRIARLVERLGSESFQDRQQASNELAKLGNQSRNQLEAAAKSDDPEIRLRGRIAAAVEAFRYVASEHGRVPRSRRARQGGCRCHLPTVEKSNSRWRCVRQF